MRELLNRVGVVGLMGSGLSACAPPAVVPVPPVAARVRTAAEARAVAVQPLQARAATLRLEAVEVAEQPDEWLVYLPYRRRTKPSGLYRVVDKQTGQVRVAVGL